MPRMNGVVYEEVETCNEILALKKAKIISYVPTKLGTAVVAAKGVNISTLKAIAKKLEGR